jgi:methanol:N,N-dimethyl-4-nitrosoaniline oxidoreductase
MIDKKIYEFPIIYSSVIGKIAIGWGVHTTVADECKMANIKKALIVTTGLKGTGIVEEINKILRTNGISTEVFNKVTSNPKDYEIMEAHKAFKGSQCDGVVSVGGGSSHDCGKGVRALEANEGVYVCDMAVSLDPPWFETIKKFRPATIPQISVNTTAGTGAESSIAAAIINTRVKAKQLIMVPGLSPASALTDPLLVRLMPQNYAAWTGYDALAHGFESFLCKMSSHYNAAMELRVLKLVAENLREFTYNRMNHEACENMCWAGSMAGVSIGFGGGVGIVHGLGHGLSVLHGVHHGLASAVVTLPLERYNQPACPGKFAEMAAAMGVDTKGMTKMQASDKWFEEIERLLSDLNIKTGHLEEQFGLQRKDIEHIIKMQYEKDFCVEGNPRTFVYEDCVKLLEEML